MSLVTAKTVHSWCSFA